MNQPYDPSSPYHEQYGGPYEPQAYGSQGYGPAQPGGGYAGVGQPGPGQPGYGYPQPPPPPQPPRSKLPIILAAGLVVVLAIGVTLFLVLRDGDSTAGGNGGGKEPGGSSPVEVTAQFFEAVDAVDEKVMNEIARGDMEDDVDDIIAQGGTDEVAFASGQVVDDASTKIDNVEIAVVVWDLTDVPDDLGETTLAVGLLDDGDGYQVCHIDDATSGGIDDMLDEWADEFEEYCDYQT